MRYAATHIASRHREEVVAVRRKHTDKVRREVESRMRHNIAYWEQRTRQLRAVESAGKSGASLNALQAERKAEELKKRLEVRLEELDK